jgi:hypothetical protein
VPTFRLAFLIEHARDLDPPPDLAGTGLAPLRVVADRARQQLADELGRTGPATLERDGCIPTVIVDVEAEDEDEALSAGFRQATLTLEPYSLIAPQGEGFDFSRHRPTVLPNALLVDESMDPPTADFRDQVGPRLLRMTLGKESVTAVRRFNEHVV